MVKNRLLKLRKSSKLINERHGNSTIGVGSVLRPHGVRRLPTGSLSLDFAMGGGVPEGRVIIYYGERSSGKTTTAYRTAGIAQGLCANCLRKVYNIEINSSFNDETGEIEYFAEGSCDCYNKGIFKPKQLIDEKDKDFESRLELYKVNSYEEFRVALIDIEGSYDIDWTNNLDIDSRRLLYVCPDTAEEVIDIYEMLMRTGAVDLFILDSIAAMTPSKEVEETMENWQQGLAARLVNKFVRVSQSAANAMYREYRRAPTQIWINQIREKIGVMYGDKTTLPCGKGQRFAAAIEVKMWANEWKKNELMKDLPKAYKMEIGNSVRMNFEIVKNKVGPAKGSGGYDMFIAGPNKGKINEMGFIVGLAEKYGEIEKKGAKWILGGKDFNRKGDLIEYLSTEPEWSRIKGLLLKKMLGDVS